MPPLIQQIVDLYNKIENVSDSKVRKWFLMNSLLVPISIVVLYLYLIFVWGPKFMKNRKPFCINKIIIVYNTVQVIFNVYLCARSFEYFWLNLHSFRCIKIDYTESENADIARAVNWLFTLNKLMDLLDTIFFVLKKKQSHVTFLHVYHHILTFVGCWTLAKYYPGGQLVVLGVLNSFVHCIMYSYYLLSLMDSFKKISHVFKKPITQMQIIQFVLAGLHGIYGVTDETCDYPKSLMYFGISQGVLMIILFANFYRKAYLRSNKLKAELQNDHLKNGTAKKVS